MKDFMLIFRIDYTAGMPAPAEMSVMEKKWEVWLNDLAEKKRLTHKGNRLSHSGKMVKPNNVVVDGPYAESKECVCGFIIVAADSLDEASEISRDCPILLRGGNVEVRDVIYM